MTDEQETEKCTLQDNNMRGAFDGNISAAVAGTYKGCFICCVLPDNRC